MTPRKRVELAQALRHVRAALLKQAAHVEADLRTIAEDRESELEERAQEDGAARVLAGLDDRDLHALAEIDAALRRIIDGTYGRCVDCDGVVPVARLRAVPSAPFCVECATERESTRREAAAPAEVRHPAPLPPDLEPLVDREIGETLRALVREDGRVDLEELRLVCRHGVIHLDGAVSSEAERQILRRLVTDVAGCEEVVDHLRVNELLQERSGRRRPAPRERAREIRFAPVGTEDVVEAAEEGLDYVPPDRPPPEEE